MLMLFDDDDGCIDDCLLSGQNYVTAADDNIFSAMIYGAADREFYANPISLKLSQGTCEQSVSVSGDGVDNDCDDVTDEEICNGLGESSLLQQRCILGVS